MNLKKQILSYAFINIINASVPFLLLPLLTKYLTPADYGILSLFQMLMMLTLPLALLNTQSLLTIEYSKLSLDKFKALVSTILFIPIVTFFLIEFLFFLFKSYILKYFSIPVEYIYFIPLFVLLQVIPTILPLLFQAQKDPQSFGKYKISMTILNLLLSLLFIIILHLGWEGRVYAIIISFFVFTIIGFIVLINLKLLQYKINFSLIKNALSFGIPLLPHTIAGITLSMADKIFIGKILDTYQVGIYSVAFQISSAILIIMTSINQAWAPNLYEKLNLNPNKDEKYQLVKTTYKVMLIMFLLTIVFISFSSLIFNIFIDKIYHEGKILVLYISLAFLFQGFYFMVTNYIFYTKKTYILSYITIISALLICFLNYYLIPYFHLLGSAYSILIVWIFQFIVVFYISNKLYPMPWRLK